jgi:hypothetical protein
MTPGICPWCERENEEATSVFSHAEVRTPRENDASICFYCGEVGVFTGNGMELRKPTDDERLMFLADVRIVAVRGAVLAHIAEKGG